MQVSVGYDIKRLQLQLSKKLMLIQLIYFGFALSLIYSS